MKNIPHLIVGCVLVCTPVASLEAETLFKLTFDSASGSSNVYESAADDVLPPGLVFKRMPQGDVAPLEVKTSDGFQGGRALVLDPSQGTRHQGYYVDRKHPPFPEFPESGVIPRVTGITQEAVVFFGEYLPGQGEILSQWGVGGMQPCLFLKGNNLNAPVIRFSVGGVGLECDPGPDFLGRWHHIAGVFSRVDGQFELEIFLDGKSLGKHAEAKPSSPQASYLVPYRGVSIGTHVLLVEKPTQPTRTPIGKIDAVALSLDVLDPKTFVLPVGPKASGR